jgi:NAD(P)H-flavin reductase
MFEKKEGSIIDTPEARLQFGQFVMLRTKQGKITYRALKDNDHDDLPMSHCLACGAMKMYERKAKRVLT